MEETGAFLNYFADGTSYLLQNGNEEVCVESDVLTSNDEQILTRFEDVDWNSVGLPIFLNAHSITEEVVNIEGNNVVDHEETMFLSESLDDNTAQSTDDDTTTCYTIYSENNDVNQNGTDEIIQLLNIDGSISTINKSLLNFESQTQQQPMKTLRIDDFFSNVNAKKCNLCACYLCESLDEIKAHLLNVHKVKIFPENNFSSTRHEQVQAQKMTSILLNGSPSTKSNKVVPYCDEDFVGSKMTSILNGTECKKIMMFLCSECGCGYSNKNDLKQHMINEHELANSNNDDSSSISSVLNQSSQDNKQVMDAVKLLKKQQRIMKKLKCRNKGCSQHFSKEELRTKHEECHVENKKQFQCIVCKEKFSLWRTCCMHLWKNHSIDLDLLTCPICENFKSTSLVTVVTHMAIHREERPFICNICGKGFKQMVQLRNHQVLHNSGDEDQTKIPNWTRARQCEHCDIYYANSKILKLHIASVHNKFKPFLCKICGHKTSRKSMLTLHYRQHTGDKPHNCLYCEYKTGDHNSLRKHTMRHYGIGKYSCSYCDYQAIQANAFKLHMFTKHPENECTFQCEQCTFTTLNETRYLSHIKLHDLEKNLIVEQQATNSSGLNSNSQQEDNNNNSNEEVITDSGGYTIPAVS